MNNNAKFYMPFAALKGYEEAIIEASKSKTKHKILLADKEEILNNLIKTIKVNDLIKLIYYNRNSYVLKRGFVDKLDYDKKFLFVDSNKIYFKDIYELEVI